MPWDTVPSLSGGIGIMAASVGLATYTVETVAKPRLTGVFAIGNANVNLVSSIAQK